MKPWKYFAITALTLGALMAQAPAPTATGIDSDAIAALNKMGNYLRTLKAFQVRAATSAEDVFDSGQKFEYDSVVELLAEKPNHLRVETSSDSQHRLFLYDGKEFTLWGERVNYYATVPAPPTIAELVDQLKEKFDIETPLADLFYWGTERSSVAEITVAMDLGPSEVQGTTCEQYVFRQPGLDWQIWIQQGDFPLPRKLILTTLTDEARPQHSSVLTWNLAPSFNDAAFKFDPPPGAQRIVMAEIK